MTGPYHAICSLNDVLKNYNDFKYAVIVNKKMFLKKMRKYLTYIISTNNLIYVL